MSKPTPSLGRCLIGGYGFLIGRDPLGILGLRPGLSVIELTVTFWAVVMLNVGLAVYSAVTIGWAAAVFPLVAAAVFPALLGLLVHLAHWIENRS